MVCWGCGGSKRDRKRLNELVRRAGSVLDCPLDTIKEVGEKGMLAKLTLSMDNPPHPLHETAMAASITVLMFHITTSKTCFLQDFIIYVIIC